MLLAMLALTSCASPVGQAGDVLKCKGAGSYVETDAGAITVRCDAGLTWSGPMSDNAAGVAGGVLRIVVDGAGAAPQPSPAPAP